MNLKVLRMHPDLVVIAEVKTNLELAKVEGSVDTGYFSIIINKFPYKFPAFGRDKDRAIHFAMRFIELNEDKLFPKVDETAINTEVV